MPYHVYHQKRKHAAEMKAAATTPAPKKSLAFKAAEKLIALSNFIMSFIPDKSKKSTQVPAPVRVAIAFVTTSLCFVAALCLKWDKWLKTKKTAPVVTPSTYVSFSRFRSKQGKRSTCLRTCHDSTKVQAPLAKAGYTHSSKPVATAPANTRRRKY